MGSISESGRIHGGGHGSPLQYSCLKNPMDRGTWRAIVHSVAKSRTHLKQLSVQFSSVQSLSRVRLFVTPWTAARQVPLSMGFFRQEYWSGLPFPSPEDLPNPGIELGSPAFKADCLPCELQGSPNLTFMKSQFKLYNLTFILSDMVLHLILKAKLCNQHCHYC